MRVFLVALGCVAFLLGLALSFVPMGTIDAATPFAPTLTPLPTGNPGAGSAAQVQMGRSINDMIWWECGPIAWAAQCWVPNPKPGFALFTVQAYVWLYDMGVLKVFMNGVTLGVAIFVFLRTSQRMRRLFVGDSVNDSAGNAPSS